ncbi:hypothetical protein C1645_773911 [Glomus cerebriforme]|uniref:HMG box domain-containing protein n=1 Tax=Glomus cerebriforme TaxID=658196 RepID=A0A397SS39_9GLOM|nr:hypothetical protein C1645_773911 [Glomus cerebriforme]
MSKKLMKKKRNEELFNLYEQDLNEVQESLQEAIENKKISTASDLLSKSLSKNGKIKKPQNVSLLFTNQLMRKCGLLDVVRNKTKNKKEIMPNARILGSILWNKINDNHPIKKHFIDLAQEVKERHKANYPNFRSVTKRRNSKKEYTFKFHNTIIEQETSSSTINTDIHQFFPPPTLFHPNDDPNYEFSVFSTYPNEPNYEIYQYIGPFNNRDDAF